MRPRAKTQVVTAPVKRRKRAREIERHLQAEIDKLEIKDVTLRVRLHGGELVSLPPWTRGVRVERAGWRQFVVVATSHQGH